MEIPNTYHCSNCGEQVETGLVNYYNHSLECKKTLLQKSENGFFMPKRRGNTTHDFVTSSLISSALDSYIKKLYPFNPNDQLLILKKRGGGESILVSRKKA